MKRSTMNLLNTAAKTIELHIHKINKVENEHKASILLNDTIGITITAGELIHLNEADDKLLFILRAIGVRINLKVQDIDWWYYNKYKANLPACI